MNVEHPLASVESTERTRPVLAGQAAGQSEVMEVTPLDRVLSLMRGRWVWAIAVAALLGVGGAVLGFGSVEPQFRSTGMIHIIPTLPKVLYDLEDHTHPDYRSFVATQATMIASQQNVRSARQRAEWDQNDAPRPSVAEFQSRLRVEHPRNSEHIFVSFDHESPLVAQVAVETAIRAYHQRHQDTAQQDDRLNMLERRRDELRSQIRGVQGERDARGEQFGARDLTPHYRARMDDVHRLHAQLRQTEMALSAAGVSLNDSGLDGGDPAVAGLDAVAEDALELDFDEQGVGDTGQTLAVEDIAAMNTQMRRLVEQRRETANQIRTLELRLGPRHRDVARAQALMEAIDEQIETEAADFRRRYAAGLIDGEAASVEELQQRYALLGQAWEEARQEAVEIGQRNMELQRLREEEEQLTDELRRVEGRIDALTTESQMGGRVTVEYHSDEPQEPVTDRRNLAAAAGLMFGGGMGFALILGIAFFDRRFRSIHDANDALGQITMLGILPRVPEDLADPDQAAVASHCVHQIRTLLQIGPDATGRRVFSITSPGAGDGKTSLTLALGVSFTATGAKTLMIDFDLGLGGLTDRAEAIIRRKIGQVLQRQHLVTEQQVEQALRIAQESNRRLGEVLVDLGYVTHEDLDEALTLQERTPVGLMDALAGEPLEHCVAETGIAGLSVLPIGAADPDDVARLSPLAIRKLMEEARQHFDVILVDTGPVPASLDASHVAVESDGVVMVFSRGEQRSQAERSLDYLASIDARIAGVVFNRAEGSDMEALGDRFSGDGAVARRSGRHPVVVDAGHERFGPVARAVAGSSRKGQAASATANGNGNGSGSENGHPPA